MSAPRLLDIFENRLVIEGELTTSTALHIGGGKHGDPLAPDGLVVRDAGGRPLIPGSSLKGVLRSAAEALLRGRAAGDANLARQLACNTVGRQDQACVSHEDLKAWREPQGTPPKEPTSRDIAAKAWQASCRVCRLFGSLALAGRLRFPDLLLVGETPPFELRNGVGIDRGKGTAADRILYDFEAVPPGTRFGLRVIFDNFDDWEVGLLLFLFSELDEGHLALGGKTTRGLGSVRVNWQRMIETRLDTSNPFRSWLDQHQLFPLAAPEKLEPPPDPQPAGPLAWPPGQTTTWQDILGLVRLQREIREQAAPQLGAQHGLNRARLEAELGLTGRQAWRTALNHLVGSGHLGREGDRFWPADTPPADLLPKVVAPASEPQTNPALGQLYRRFLGAAELFWEDPTCLTA